MTTTEPLGTAPAGTRTRVLRRSRSDRVGAGVAGGLGQYFGLDPVLFRVLFATAAFFGGAGILAYLLAWAAVPEEGTERAAVDGWIMSLRRRHVPFWLVAVVAGLFLWIVAFSWWAPGPFFPVLAVVVLLAVAVTRSSRRDVEPLPPTTPGAWPITPMTPTDGAPSLATPWAAGATTTETEPVSLTKDAEAGPAAPPFTTPPAWLQGTRDWVAESTRARRERKRRALPVKIATLAVLGSTLLVLGLVDAAHGIALPLYFWLSLIILGVGLLVGLALRRTPWSLVALLVPTLIGVVGFAGSSARLHDGVGDRQWRPTVAPAAHYRLAFGRATVDLRALPAQTAARTIRIDVAAGQVRILAPRTMNLTVYANVHAGSVQVDSSFRNEGGFNYNRVIDAPAGATGAPITVDVHLADGDIDVTRS